MSRPTPPVLPARLRDRLQHERAQRCWEAATGLGYEETPDHPYGWPAERYGHAAGDDGGHE
jgi:hypothetical protein